MYIYKYKVSLAFYIKKKKCLGVESIISLILLTKLIAFFCRISASFWSNRIFVE